MVWRTLGVIALALGLSGCAPAPPPEPFDVVEATIPEMQLAMTEGRITSRALVTQYLVRIAWYENELNAAMHVSRRALDEADRLDEERWQGRVRGPLHGIPIALKNIIHTTDMPTTGGALAFEGYYPPYDATLVEKLREAGAVIIAKTVNTELANWVASGMPATYSALGGYGLNPYDPRRDPREGLSDGRGVMTTGGSSSGTGTAASFWAASVGTETSGSILSPTSDNMLAGIKPTVGRISRYGIMPITADQDTAGPMARSIVDAAILLGAMEGIDPEDPATGVCEPPANHDYTAYLHANALADARIGVPRDYFFEAVSVPGQDAPRGGLNPAELVVMEDAIVVLRRMGAEVVDPVDIPSLAEFLDWPICAGEDGAKGSDEDCSVILKYGMKRDFNAWLATLGDTAPVASLTALREFNLENSHRNAIRYAQAQLDISDEMDVEADRERYLADRAKDIELAATRGIDATLEEHGLDALLFPSYYGSNLAARPGYPTVMVPFGTVPNDRPGLPEDFEPKPRPFGVSFTGAACSEPRLLAIGYAFEQATRRRVAPAAFP